MVIAATIYALGMLITASLLMLLMFEEGSDSNRELKAIYKLYPFASQLAVILLGIVVLWPALWFTVIGKSGRKSHD